MKNSLRNGWQNSDRTKVFFLDIYLESKNILTSDYFTPDEETGNITFDTSFEIYTSLTTGFFEFKLFSTQCNDIQQRDYLSRKNVEELLHFSDTESNDNILGSQTQSLRKHTTNIGNYKYNYNFFILTVYIRRLILIM